MRVSGIYKIINKSNGKYYVGSSDHIHKRFYDHKIKLIKNSHINSKLQNSWNKYGEEHWDWNIIEEIPSSDLLLIEQKYLDIAKLEKHKCYNIVFDASSPMRGRTHSVATKSKMRKTHSKINHKKFSHKKQTKQHLSELMKGRYIGVNNPNFGKKHSKETRLKMGTPDQTIFTFQNVITKDTFTGIRSDFSKKYNFDKANLYNLIHKRSNNCKGWVVVSYSI